MKKKGMAAICIMMCLALSAGLAWATEIDSGSLTSYGHLAGGSGISSSFFGEFAGNHNSGAENTFIGAGAGQENTTGLENTFIGTVAGQNNQSGYGNTYIGYAAGNQNTGYGNVFIGYLAGYDLTAASNLLYIANINSATPLIYGEFDSQKVKINGTFKVTGLIESTTDGFKFPDGTTQTTALTGISGSSTTSFGSGAGTTGDYSTYVGFHAGFANIGTFNSFFGYLSGGSNSSGYGNSFFGGSAGINTQNGHENTFIGSHAGVENIAGSGNVYIGEEAGNRNKGSGNIFIGFLAGSNETTAANKLFIANSATSSPLIYGEFDTPLVKINGDFQTTGKITSSSDERLKKNIEPLKSSLDKVMNLKGVSYEWREDSFVKGRDIGLIAQEVEAVIPELVVTDSKGYKSLSYDRVVPVLVEAIKEQQDLIKGLKGEMAKLSAEVNRLKSRDMSAQK